MHGSYCNYKFKKHIIKKYKTYFSTIVNVSQVKMIAELSDTAMTFLTLLLVHMHCLVMLECCSSP